MFLLPEREKECLMIKRRTRKTAIRCESGYTAFTSVTEVSLAPLKTNKYLQLCGLNASIEKIDLELCGFIPDLMLTKEASFVPKSQYGRLDCRRSRLRVPKR